MFFYISIFIILGFTLYLDYIYDIPILKKIIYVTLVIFFILLAGLRWETGTDWDTYYVFFRRSGSYNTLHFEKTMEIGFRYLNFAIRNTLHTFTWFLLVCAIIIISLKAYYLKKYLPLFFLGLFLYYAYFFADIFFVRQSLAISITLVSTRYIIKRKFFYFLTLVLLATSIHTAAIIFVFAYWMYPLRIPGYIFFILIGISFVFMLVGGDVLIFNGLLKAMGIKGLLAYKLAFYAKAGSSATFGSGISRYAVLLLGGLKRIIIFPAFLWGKKWISEEKKTEYNGMLNLCLLGACLYFLFGNFAALQRGSTYFTFYEILAIIMLVNALRGKISAVITYTLVIVYAFTKFYYGFAAYRDLYVPYYSIFSKHIERIVH